MPNDNPNECHYKPFGPNDLQTKIWPPMQTRDGRWVRTGPETMPGGEDTFVAYGAGWANVSNTPFRGNKHDAYEGGISTPLIVHWPAGIAADRNGARVHEPTHLIDLLATFVDAAGAEYPREFRGTEIQPLEGLSLLPALAGNSLRRDAPLCFEHHGNKAARKGRWKIVSAYRHNQPTRWELYDMETDRVESTDVSAQNPERKQQLVAAWDEWAKRVGVQPWPFPAKTR